MQSGRLEQYPDCAVLIREGLIGEANEKARALLKLQPGDRADEQLLLPEGEEQWEGAVTLEGRGWQLSARRGEDGTLCLIRPLEQAALREGQMDGALYQMRRLMSRFHQELAPCISGEREALSEEQRAGFAGSYYRMLRLIDHMDLLRDAAQGGLRLAEEQIELVEFCRQVVLESDGLLRETGIRTRFQAPPTLMYVSGDKDLLRDALLELISNCAARCGADNVITLRLTKQGGRGLVCVTDDAPPPGSVQRAALTTRGGMPLIPTPTMGAGLGLSVAEAILQAHGGAMMISADGPAPRVYITLPLKRRTFALRVKEPRPERNAGMSPYLIALSDVLPGGMVLEDWKE